MTSSKGNTRQGKKRGGKHDPAAPLLPGVDAALAEDPAWTLRQALGDGAFVAGLDEVGRGPLAGPVVAAAVVLDEGHGIVGLNDSKKLTEKKREALFAAIHDGARAVGVGIVEAPQIDRMNILQASLEAMRLAFVECEQTLGPIAGAAVDGNKRAPLPERVKQVTVVGGDARSEVIMAASIIAKVIRDRRMVKEGERFPMYGFAKHKGYPTPAHQAALKEHGPCVLHRHSFAPVRQAASARSST